MNTYRHGAVLVVTGGSRGIGAEVCRLGAARDYQVVINYCASRETAEALADEISGNGGLAHPFQGDVSNERDVVSLFEFAATLGTVGALVNNAGILEQQMDLVDMSPDRIDRVFAVNVRGSILCAREAIRLMARSRGGEGGAIVNVSSAASRLGSPHEYIDYAASKGAIDTLTLGLSKEVAAEGIRVNAVRPGIIETEIHARGGEAGRVERVAPMVPMQRAGKVRGGCGRHPLAAVRRGELYDRSACGHQWGKIDLAANIATLYYAHDPMCSWCWAFSPRWRELLSMTSRVIRGERMIGSNDCSVGLAPDGDLPMPETMQLYLKQTWSTIQRQVPGTRFQLRLLDPMSTTTFPHGLPAARSSQPASRASDTTSR